MFAMILILDIINKYFRLYLGKEHPKTHSYVIAQFPTWGGNLLPDNELPGFRKLISEYVTELTKLGDKMMELISLSLGLPEDFIAKNVTLDHTWTSSWSRGGGKILLGVTTNLQFRGGKMKFLIK